MMRFFKKASQKTGLSPGAVVYTGEKKIEKIRISIIDYDETELQEKEVEAIEECFPFKDTPTVTWINIDGIHQVDIIEKVGKHFGLHPLIQEDIVHSEQRPKFEDQESQIFLVLKMFHYDEKAGEIEVEQISIILGENFVISFQEKEGDVFTFIRERIKNHKGRVRKMGADYLAYSLVDAIVDHYFVILEKLGERIEILEEELITHPKPEALQEIHTLRRELILLRKSVWPLREVVSELEKGGSALVQESTVMYLRDVYDHTVRVIETIEIFRDMVTGMFEVYRSSVSNKTNEVMKVLTIIATIFIPLTFIAGIYGMNFKYLPELDWHWGYPVLWLIMLSVAGVMVASFRKKRWL